MTSRSKPPFRAEHVGSLPRPERLMQARAAHASHDMTLSALRAIEDDCIRDALAMQDRVGIGAITDGEFRRTSWRDAPFENFDGFTSERHEADFTFTLFDGSTRKAGPVPETASRVRRRTPMAAEHFTLLNDMTKGPTKANLPTPSVTHFFRGDRGIDRAVYPDIEAFFADVTSAYREEIADLAARGCRYLQMDEVPLALLCDQRNQEIVRQRGEDPARLVDHYIDAINACIAERPEDMAVCVHMCRGNMGHGMADGGYESIAERMFNTLDVDGCFLEYDTPRAGDFAPLRHLPAPKKAVLGLLTTKDPTLESADALKARIEEASGVIDIDRLCLSPQCGFSSNAGTGRFSMIGIGGRLAAPPLPHHRAYGSVPRRFDRVNLERRHGVGGDRVSRKSGCAAPVGPPGDWTCARNPSANRRRPPH